MYIIEWGLWQMAIESDVARKKFDAERSAPDKRADRDFYEGDFEKETHFRSVSEAPKVRGQSLRSTIPIWKCVAGAQKKNAD